MAFLHLSFLRGTAAIGMIVVVIVFAFEAASSPVSLFVLIELFLFLCGFMLLPRFPRIASLALEAFVIVIYALPVERLGGFLPSPGARLFSLRSGIVSLRGRDFCRFSFLHSSTELSWETLRATIFCRL